MCGKVCYSSQREANSVLNSMHKSKDRGRTFSHRGKKIPCRAYYCDECGAWHLTSLSGYDCSKSDD